MWTKQAWESYLPRLRRWMEIFEDTGRRHGLTSETGYLLGTDAPGVADLTTHILWGTMTDLLQPLRPILNETAPAVAGLSDRISALPEQEELSSRSRVEYGGQWCGGEIEASLRAVL